MPALERYLLSPWALAGAVLLSFFAAMGGYALFDLDEGAFSQATLEMLASGEYLMTYLDGQPRYDKPILIYWLQALSVRLFGAGEFAFRLPSALAASAWAVALFYFARQVLDRPTAAVAVLIMVNALVVTIIGKSATADALLNLWLALIFFDMYRYYLAPSNSRAMRVYLWMALGVLTKGPIAVALPFAVGTIFFVWSGAGRQWLRALTHPLGWLVLLVVATPWHVLVYLEHGTAFFEGFLLRHNVERFTDGLHGHRGNPLYYVFMLPLVLLPFTGWFFRILGRARDSVSEPLDRLLWIWFAVVFVLFSFSQTQLPHYVLYGCTPLFILMARHRELLINRWLAYLPPALFLLLLLFFPELLAFAAKYADRAYEIEMLGRGSEVLGHGDRILPLLSLTVLLACALSKAVKPWQGLLITALMHTATVNWMALPVAAGLQQEPVREAALVARQYDRPVVAVGINMPSFSVYRGAPTLRREPRPGDLVFIRVDRLHRLDALAARAQLETIYRKGGVALVLVEEADEQQ